jgi:hypothetical protein
MRILPQVLHMLEIGQHFFYFYSQQCQFTTMFFFSVAKVSHFKNFGENNEFLLKKIKKTWCLEFIGTDPDRPDPDQQALDDDSDPTK